jgi:xylulokinase
MSLTNSLRDHGIRVDKIIVTEGGSKSDLWNQIKADALDAEVLTLKRKEGAVMSNIALAAYAVGDIKDLKESISKWIEAKDAFKPDGGHTKYYNETFAIREKLLKQDMNNAFSSLSDLRL